MTDFKLIEFIHSLKKYSVTELKHAYRINGVIDIWKNSTTLYDKVLNEYSNHDNLDKLKTVSLGLLQLYPKREDYTQKKNGISLAEFKNKIRNEKYDPYAIRGEDYLWVNNKEETSEDDLYFLVKGDEVKIGRSVNPSNRLSSLKTSITDTVIMYVFRNKGLLEREFHRVFKDIHIEREWYRLEFRTKNFLNKYHNQETGYTIG